LQESGTETAELFPPGPLEVVAIRPNRIVIEVNGEKPVRARPLDASGRRIGEGIDLEWEIEGQVGALRQDSEDKSRMVLVAGEAPGRGSLSVRVSESATGREASAAAPVEIVESLSSSSDEGIPEPELVDAPGAAWRSRLHEARWQVNSGHADYKTSSDRPALKLRYLAMLFAKEVVLRSSQDPRLEDPLEQLVEVAAYADRRLTDRAPRRRKSEE
ncbi:MAG: hypothetical protein ACRD3V_23740, partial [Vicinamibacteria bacterium]